MNSQPNLLKVLLTERHLQNHRVFCREYDKQAAQIDSSLIGTYPSRAQFYRWVSGDISGLPYPDHCRVLEAIFQGHKATDLFSGLANAKAGTEIYSAAPTLDLLRAALQGRLPAVDLATVWASRPQSTDRNKLATNTNGLDLLHDDAQVVAFISSTRVLRLPDNDATKLASLFGNIVELELAVHVDIEPDGWATVSYDHTIMNMSTRPLSRLMREVWFENTSESISIDASTAPGHSISIERIHDSKNMAKFACLIDPPLAPCDQMAIRYMCSGGRFVSDHYWRQLYPRYTRWATIHVRDRQAGPLSYATISEEFSDGFVTDISDDLLSWDDESGIALIVTRDYLRPNQALTLRWDHSG